MKYKLQLILTAIGILLTTVCHAQTSLTGKVVSAQTVQYRDGTETEVTIQTADNRYLRIGCDPRESTCLMPLAGTNVTLRVDFIKIYHGTNVAILYGHNNVGFYGLICSY